MTSSAGSAATPRRTGSLRRRVRVVFGISIVIAVLAIALGAVGLNRLVDARHVLVDRVDPALAGSERLLSAMVDKESGVRAFVIGRQEIFLEPYERGHARRAAIYAELQDQLAGVPELTDELLRVDDTVTAWRETYAEPTIEQVRAGDPEPSEGPSLNRGRRLFEDFRAAMADFQTELQERRDAARTDLDQATNQLIAILVVSAGALLTAVGALWWLVRRSVEVPLDELRGDARTVSEGHYDHRVVPVGPAELRELAEAMEMMRERIVSDLAAAELAHATVQQQAEELDRANADLSRSNTELEQFAYVASHDLQEPLRKVASFCQLLQKRYGGQLDERGEQYIEFAVDGAKRMQVLINDLLAFSRVGRLAGEAVEVDLGEALAQARSNLATAIEEADATIEADPLPVVRGEPALLVALFQNLVGNAVKFRRPDAAPVVRITSAMTPDGGGYEIVVRDNGIGIAPDYAERVFVIFQRLHTKDAYEGTGIGLALCRKIVEHHGGEIVVDPPSTAPDEMTGAAFRITLPTTEKSPL
ncbi:MAG TPA: CHASE3 domain-containing protein [Iamia sp.]|nr:CHASE3 domain-containing protein [Iamia sp.]